MSFQGPHISGFAEVAQILETQLGSAWLREVRAITSSHQIDDIHVGITRCSFPPDSATSVCGEVVY
jgi:hypothetical protein